MTIRFLTAAILLILLNEGLSAQQNENSPYSRYGIGNLSENNFIHLQNMGGINASYADAYHINIHNPATLPYLSSTAFDLGLFGKHTWLNDGNSSNRIWSGNLEYMALAFPLRNPINEIYEGIKKNHKFAMSFALMPYSNVNYNIAAVDSISTVGNFTRKYVGSGGTYKFMWGNAMKYKNYSFGVNLGYLFGNLSYENRLIFQPSQFAYDTNFKTSYGIRGWLYNLGFLYTKTINQKAIEDNKTLPARRISAGIHLNSQTSFSTTYTKFDYLEQSLPAGITIIDTIDYKDSIKGKGILPAEMGFGFTYFSGEKHSIGINYNTSLWSKYYNEASGEQKGSLNNAYRISMGGYYRPDYKSFTSFFKRVYYRYGLYYSKDPRVINAAEVQTYGLTLGMGMPFVFQRKVSHANIGLNMGIRGANTPISEKFVKISFGVTFNDDEWFLKRKYN